MLHKVAACDRDGHKAHVAFAIEYLGQSNIFQKTIADTPSTSDEDICSAVWKSVRDDVAVWKTHMDSGEDRVGREFTPNIDGSLTFK